MSLYNCLKPAVGLSQQDCNCLTEGRPEDYNASVSGYYIDDMEHGVPLIYPQNATDCGDGDVWDLLERARVSGVNDFQEKMALSIGDNKTRNYNEFLGYIGDEENNSIVDSSQIRTTLGVRFKSNAIRGGVMKIKKISLIINTTGNYDVKFYNVTDGYVSGSPVATETITVTTANRHEVKTLANDIELPMTVDGVPQIYVAIYEPGAARPRNTQFTCGCSGTARRRGWMQYFDSYQGFASDDDAGIETPTLTTSITYGLRFHVNIECDGTAFICSDQVDFSKPDYSKVIAKAVQLCAINKLLHAIMSSDRINRYTKMSGEMIIAKMDKNQSEIQDRIQWLSTNIPDDLTDCYSCKRGSIMGTIRAT